MNTASITFPAKY